jgi:hypothetical protein
MVAHAILGSVAGPSSTSELRSAWAMSNRRSSADEDKSGLWRTYPALKPECGVENALHVMNGKGPIFGARMGIDGAWICKLIVCVDDLSVFGGNRVRGCCCDLASVYQDVPALKIANVWTH